MVGRGRFAIALLSLPILLSASPSAAEDAASRRFTAEDLVRMEAFGGARVDPAGRWVVWERRGRYDRAATYAYATLTSDLLTDLVVADATGARPDLTLGADDEAGYRAGPFSPDGRRMLVYRLTMEGRSLGVLTLETGQVAWFPLSVDLPVLGRTAAWRDDAELVLLLTPEDRQPLYYRLGWETQALTATAWRTAQTGREATALQIWSGAGRDRRAQRGAGRLASLRVDDGMLRILAEGEFFDLEVAPGGATVATLENAEELQTSGGRLTIGDPTRRRRLRLIDLEHGSVREPLADRDPMSHLLSWSADGARLLVFSRTPGEDWDEGRFQLVTVEGRASNLDLGGLRPAVLRISGEKIPIVRGGWAGDAPAVLVEAPEGRRWFDLNDRVLVETDPLGRLRSGGRGGVWFDGAEGVGPWRGDIQAHLRFAEDGATRDGGSRAAWNPASAAPRAAARPDGCVVPIEAGSPAVCLEGDGRRVAATAGASVVLEARADGVTAVTLVRAESVRPLGLLNGDLADVDWGEVREVAHAGVDGRPLKSWLLRPAGPTPTDGHPLVVMIYPGRVHDTVPAALRPGSESGQINAGILASAGYAVLVPSLPLDPGDDGSLPDLAQRIDVALDAALAGGGLDPDRVALAGHSYGGRGVLIAGAQTGRYRALISSAGTPDYGAGFQETLHSQAQPADGMLINAVSGYYESGQGGLGTLPWEDPAGWTRASPFYVADRILTPTLLIRGDLDPVGAERLFAALYRLDREASLVTYRGEGHVMTSPANIVDLHRRVLDWLDERLAPRPEARAPTPEP